MLIFDLLSVQGGDSTQCKEQIRSQVRAGLYMNANIHNTCDFKRKIQNAILSKKYQ